MVNRTVGFLAVLMMAGCGVADAQVDGDYWGDEADEAALGLPTAKTDVLWVIDDSCSMSGTSIDLVKSVVRSFTTSRRDERIGLIVFSSGIDAQVHFTTRTREVTTRVTALAPNGGTNTADALRLAATMVSTGTRSEKPMKVVLVSDGVPNDEASAVAAAEALPAHSLISVSIGWGGESFMRRIADPNAFFIMDPNSDPKIVARSIP